MSTRKGPEAKIEDAIRRYARTQGVLCLKFTSPACKGVPDRLLVFPNGVCAFMEIKAAGKKPTPLQAHWLHKLRAQGARAEYVDSIEGGKNFIDEVLFLN